MVSTTTWGLLLSQYTPLFIVCVAFLLLLEQITYQKKKRFLPGPTFVLPFIGNAISLVKQPTKFWEDQSTLAKSSPLGVSVNYIGGRFILYTYSTDMTRKIFNNIRPDAFQVIGHPFGKKLFGEHNLIYLFGQEHKDLRRALAPNFTPTALSLYTRVQHRIILKHIKSWLQQSNPSKPVVLRSLCREMNLETSQALFIGSYLSEEAQKRFSIDYSILNKGLLALPFDYPGSAFRNARRAVSRLVQTLAACSEESEKKMINGDEPTCLIDFWIKDTLNSKSQQPKEAERIDHKEYGAHLFDFLMAAQDASTSSLLWAVTLLDSHPHVLDRVRLEVAKYWTPESDEPISGIQLMEMKFTEAVAREVVRLRPPGTMMPHNTLVDFPLTKDYFIPKGTLIFPSVYDSSFQGFVEPELFDPDRFMEERQEDQVYKKNYMSFGTGPHQCLGQRYAIRHLMLFIALFATVVDFKRDRVYGCDDFVYTPTIVPKDLCSVFISPR